MYIAAVFLLDTPASRYQSTGTGRTCRACLAACAAINCLRVAMLSRLVRPVEHVDRSTVARGHCRKPDRTRNRPTHVRIKARCDCRGADASSSHPDNDRAPIATLLLGTSGLRACNRITCTDVLRGNLTPSAYIESSDRLTTDRWSTTRIAFARDRSIFSQSPQRVERLFLRELSQIVPKSSCESLAIFLSD